MSKIWLTAACFVAQPAAILERDFAEVLPQGYSPVWNKNGIP